MLGLSLTGESDPWAPSFGQLACGALECCLGAYQADSSSLWMPPVFWDADDIALEMFGAPNTWTDGSREDYPVGGFEVAGAGVYLPAPELAMDGAVWCVAEEYGDAWLERCRAFYACAFFFFSELGQVSGAWRKTSSQPTRSVNSTPTNTARTELRSIIPFHHANTRGSRTRIAHLCVPKTNVIHVSCHLPCRT